MRRNFHFFLPNASKCVPNSAHQNALFLSKIAPPPKKKNCCLLREVRQRSCPWYTFFESKEQTNTYGVSGKVIMIPSIGRRVGGFFGCQFVELNYPISLKKRILAYLRSRKFPIKKHGPNRRRKSCLPPIRHQSLNEFCRIFDELVLLCCWYTHPNFQVFTRSKLNGTYVAMMQENCFQKTHL